MHDTTHVTILLALLCTACVAGPADGESGTATEGGETGDTGDEPEPIACRAPCAIVSVTATQYLFYAELWAVELGVEGEPNGTPQPLFDGSVFASNLIGPTPWGHVAAYAWNETGQLSIADDTLVFDPLLPDAFAAMTTDLAFSDDARFAFAHVTEELFSGQRLWGVAFEGDVAVDMGPTLAARRRVAGQPRRHA